ncbi:MAG: complex I NDUFA9 subunit family protein [Rhodoferax sp.]
MKHILVIGGTGFVGAHVCEKLVRAGFRVSVPTRRAVHARKIQHLPGLTVLDCNVHDEFALTQAMADVDGVVNLVAILHGTPESFDRVHRLLPEKIARACTAQGVRQLVHVSALGTDWRAPHNCPSNYLRSKGQGEAALMQCLGWPQAPENREDGSPRIGLTVLRPSVIFGANDKFLNVFARLQKMLPVMPLAGANARFQAVWVEDVACAVVRSMGQGLSGPPAWQLYELVGPQVYTLRELVQLAARHSGIGHGNGRLVLGLPRWMGRLQAMVLSLMPGEPVMSVDNLDSMRVDNVATGQWPGFEALGIIPATLAAIAPTYLVADRAGLGLLGVRRHAH